MEDEQIIDLYLNRNEAAISETEKKYGPYCMKIAMNILESEPDSEECVNDVWLKTWNSIPPNRPQSLATYLGKITRNISINKYKMKYAGKRAEGEFAVSLDELDECVPGGETMDMEEQARLIGKSISEFLHTQKELARKVFVCRYFYCDSVSEIAERFDISESHVKSLRFRTRSKLKTHLEREGITV